MILYIYIYIYILCLSLKSSFSLIFLKTSHYGIFCTENLCSIHSQLFWIFQTVLAYMEFISLLLVYCHYTFVFCIEVSYWSLTLSPTHIFWVRIRSKRKKKVLLSHSWMLVMKTTGNRNPLIHDDTCVLNPTIPTDKKWFIGQVYCYNRIIWPNFALIKKYLLSNVVSK